MNHLKKEFCMCVWSSSWSTFHRMWHAFYYCIIHNGRRPHNLNQLLLAEQEEHQRRKKWNKEATPWCIHVCIILCATLWSIQKIKYGKGNCVNLLRQRFFVSFPCIMFSSSCSYVLYPFPPEMLFTRFLSLSFPRETHSLFGVVSWILEFDRATHNTCAHS